MAAERNRGYREPAEQHLNAPRIIVVLLRRPRQNQSDERRDDPFWEAGSFGCTKCHRGNLMNPKRSHELNGVRFAFVQGGDLGFRLVHVTSPIKAKCIGLICEANWSPPEMPLTYETAPVVVDEERPSDIPHLAGLVRHVMRPTLVSRFASAFRSRRQPLPREVGAQVLAVYNRFRKIGEVATRYDQAMPYPPPMIERDRIARYNFVRGRRLDEAR